MSMTHEQLDYHGVTKDNWMKSPVWRFVEAFYPPLSPFKSPGQRAKRIWEESNEKIAKLQQKIEAELKKQNEALLFEVQRIWDVQPQDVVVGMVGTKEVKRPLIVARVIPDQIDPFLVRPTIEYFWYGKLPPLHATPIGRCKLWMPICTKFQNSNTVRQLRADELYSEVKEFEQEVAKSGSSQATAYLKEFLSQFMPKDDAELVSYHKQRGMRREAFEELKEKLKPMLEKKDTNATRDQDPSAGE